MVWMLHAGSRFTSATESRYAPIEGETLAVADALEKARYFVLGYDNLIIAVDHKPLLKLLGDRSLENIPNARLRNLKEKTLRYRFQMMYVPGAKHRAADAVSRHPTGDPETVVLIDDVASISPTHVCDTLNLPMFTHINDCNTAHLMTTHLMTHLMTTHWNLPCTPHLYLWSVLYNV